MADCLDLVSHKQLYTVITLTVTQLELLTFNYIIIYNYYYAIIKTEVMAQLQSITITQFYLPIKTIKTIKTIKSIKTIKTVKTIKTNKTTEIIETIDKIDN